MLTDDDLGKTMTCKVTDSSGTYEGTLTSNGIGPVEKEFAFATYSSADNSFNMYKRILTKVPAAGDVFSSKTAANVYLDLENSGGSESSWNQPWHDIASNVKVAEVVDENIKPTTMHTWFLDFSNMTEIKNFTKLDTSANQWCRGTFADCSSLTSVDLSAFDTSNVEDMGAMFENCTNLASVDVSGFNTSKCVNMCRMFSCCSNLKTITGLTGFDTSKTGQLNSSGIDKGNGINGMFQSCSVLESLDLSSFITTSNTPARSKTVGGLSFMFVYCNNLKTLVIPKSFGILNTGTIDPQEDLRVKFPVKMRDVSYGTEYEGNSDVPVITMEPCPRTFVRVD